MDYIWLIRDSLSANNAIYFQFTIFFFCKTRHITSDNEGFFRAAHTPLPVWVGHRVFHGVDNELQLLLFHFQLCHVP